MIRDLEELLEFTRIDFAPLYEKATQESELQPGDVLPEDRVFHRGDGHYHQAKRQGVTL